MEQPRLTFQGTLTPSFSGSRCRPALPGEPGESASGGQVMAMVALGHTPAEHHLYEVLYAATVAAKTRVCAYTTREIMALTQLSNYHTIRRCLSGLIDKLSIENHMVVGGSAARALRGVYLIFSPEEILARRAATKRAPFPKPTQRHEFDSAFGQAIEGVVARQDLTRREAQVALCCLGGLTNTEIGERLFISEQTVKFHLRHIFLKYGVKRRTELVSRILTREESPAE